MKGRLPVPYPFLAAAYPVLALAAAHAGELVTARDLGRPLLLSLGTAAGAWLCSRLATPDPHRRAIVTFVAVVVFATYGYWQTLLKDVLNLPQAADTPVLLTGFAVFMALTVWAARRPGPSFPAVARYLNLTLALLVLGAGLGTLWRFMHSRSRVSLEAVVPSPAARGVVRPHVFLVVLDKYTGPRSLRSNFGYDNAPFEHFLESRGFRVIRHGHANYIHTFLALASLLNWEYLRTVTDSLGPAEERWDVLYGMIEDNRTARLLKQLGYRFVFFPTAFAATAGNDLADLQLPHPNDLTREFEMVWFRTTILYPISDHWSLRERRLAVRCGIGGVAGLEVRAARAARTFRRTALCPGAPHLAARALPVRR
jgi:hypothetical protein